MPLLTGMYCRQSDSPAFEQQPHILHLLAGHVNPEDDVAQHSVYIPIPLAQRSAYLSSCIQPLPSHGSNFTIKLPNVEPAALKLYVWWLASSGAPLFLHDIHGPVSQPHYSLRWRDCFDLVQAHILGSVFGDAEFTRYILAQLELWLAPQQEPDLELLDYLWEKIGEEVNGELLEFAMGGMFGVEAGREGVLVRWMKRVTRGRRMMEYDEIGRDSGVKEKERKIDKMTETFVERLLKGKAKRRREEVEGLGRSSSDAVRMVGTVRDSIRRDNISSPLQDIINTVLQKSKNATQNTNRRPRSCSPSHGSHSSPTAPTWRPRSNALRSPAATPPLIKRNHTPSSLEEELAHLPPPLRIHPMAMAGIANTSLYAEAERERSRSPMLHQKPKLHSMLWDALVDNSAESRPRQRSPSNNTAELRGGARSTTPPVTMPAIPDESLRLLDFWTNPSNPSDVPGPEFWADAFSSASVPRPASPRDALHTDAPARGTRISAALKIPANTATTKQIIHSFTLTRTPTPRRRSTRSWSVASIRSLDKEPALQYRKQCSEGNETPGRRLISRKPVPRGGVEFLGRYVDGEKLVRVVSVNSRPRRNVNAERRGGEVEMEAVWEWEGSGRPGSG